MVDAPLLKDTVIVKDTVKIEIPIPKEIKVVKTDTVYLPSVDKEDSIKALLPIQQRIYGDSTFRAVISGYKPKLDSLIIFPTKTTVIERKVLKTSGNGFKISPSIRCGVWCNKQESRYLSRV